MAGQAAQPRRDGGERRSNAPEVQRGKGRMYTTVGMTPTIIARPPIEEAKVQKKKKKTARDRSSEGRR